MILKFIPIFKHTLWGGDNLLPYKHIEASSVSSKQPVGESWEISGIEGCSSVVSEGEFKGLTLNDLMRKMPERIIGAEAYSRYGDSFPLLLKFIDARTELSVQVHPNDELAAKRHGSNGKAEMWYILGAKEKAFLRSGFKEVIDRQTYDIAVENDDICSLLNKFSITPGDVFYIPPGCIHNIGPGTFLIELQQSADITYRIYDFKRRDIDGNLRELHTELAREAVDLNYAHPKKVANINPSTKGRTEILKTNFFSMHIENVKEPLTEDRKDRDEFVILTCLKGKGKINSENTTVELSEGESLLVTADTESYQIVPDSGNSMQIIYSSL